MIATVSALAVEALLANAQEAGIPIKPLYDQLGWSDGPPMGVELWRLRIPMETYGQLWLALAERASHTHETALGLYLGTQAQTGRMGILGYVMLSCPTLRAALEKMLWAKRLLSDDLVILESYGDRVAIRYELAQPSMPGARYVVEHACAALISTCQWLTGTNLLPQEVWSSAPSTPDHARFAATLGVAILPQQPYNACFYTAKDLSLPLVGANVQIHQQLLLELARQLDALQAGVSFQQRIQLCLVAPWPPGSPPTLPGIAKELGCSTRTLQRQLQQKGISFRELVQKAQQERAYRLLSEPALSLDEIAWQVGFSEASTFSRAFRRWTGETPGAFRRRWAQDQSR